MAQACLEKTSLSFDLDAGSWTNAAVFEQKIAHQSRIVQHVFECLETHFLQLVLAEFMPVAGLHSLNSCDRAIDHAR